MISTMAVIRSVACPKGNLFFANLESLFIFFMYFKSHFLKNFDLLLKISKLSFKLPSIN